MVADEPLQTLRDLLQSSGSARGAASGGGLWRHGGGGGARPAHTRSPGLRVFANLGAPAQLHPGLRKELSGLDALFSRWNTGGGWL
jgi:hypothetical protein